MTTMISAKLDSIAQKKKLIALKKHFGVSKITDVIKKMIEQTYKEFKTGGVNANTQN